MEDNSSEEVGEPQFFFASEQGDNQPYSPDIVRLGGCWGVKLGMVVIIFRE